MCCVPQDAIPLVIKKIMNEQKINGEFGIRKTISADIVRRVPKWDNDKGNLLDKRG